MTVTTACFEIINFCNLNCSTCYNRSGLNHERTEISKEQLKESIALFQRYGLTRVLLSGGEPTLHSRFEGILDLTDEYPNLSFTIITNGINHHPKLIDILNSRQNVTLQVSLDGSCEEQNAKTRGAGNFTKTLEFIRQLNTLKTQPLVKMVISQSNYDDVEAFYRLIVSVNAVPEFAFINRRGNGSDNWEQKNITAKQKLNALTLIDKLNQELDVKAFLPLCTSECPYAVSNTDNMSVSIKIDGSIQPCQLLYDAELSLGNIYSLNPGQFESRVGYIAGLAKQRRETDYGCSRCTLNHICGRGCIALACSNNGAPLADDMECEFRKLQFWGHNMKDMINQTESRICPFINVDINTDIMWGEANSKTDMSYVMKQTTETEICGIKVKKLTPVMEFISLCLHHYKDMNSIYLLWQGSLNLALLCDIYFYLKNNRLDADELKEICKRLNSSEYVYYCLYYTREIFGDDFLQHYLSAVKTERAADILGAFGLDESEIKQWDTPFSERLFCNDFQSMLDRLLTDKDRKKVSNNMKFM